MVLKVDTENSRIIFSVKGFIAVITFIFSVFFGFYLLVVNPRMQETDRTIEKNATEQKQINKELSNSLTTLNITMAQLTEAIKNMKENNVKK